MIIIKPQSPPVRSQQQYHWTDDDVLDAVAISGAATSQRCRWAENGQLAPKAWAIFVRPGQRAMTADLIAIAPNRQVHVGQRL